MMFCTAGRDTISNDGLLRIPVEVEVGIDNHLS